MKLPNLAVPAVSVLALAAASAASAEVSAQDVWDSWKANLGDMDAEDVTIGSEEYSDGVLTVSDILFSVADETGTIDLSIGSLVFTEQGDGTVSITMSEEMPFTVAATDSETGEEMAVDLALRQQDLELIASGTAEEMIYDIGATRLAVDLDNISDGNATGSGSFVLNDLAGTYTVVTDDMQSIDYDLAAGSLDLAFSMDDPDEEVVFGMKGSVAEFALTASFVTPLPGTTTPDTILADGLAGEGSYSLGASRIAFDMTVEGMPVAGTLTTTGGTLDAAVSADGISYASDTTGLVIEATSEMLPFPINISLARYGIDFAMPLSATEEPAPFAFGINLTDLTVNEEIWALADPGAVLPHDPATLILDLTGTARLFVDLTDPTQTAALAEADMPGEVHSVSLNNLTVSAAGASLTGTGAFTFDNSDTTTIPGIPRPEGKLELAASGINTLMDNLVAMGLLPQEQVMGARMMLGLFTVATGDDQLSTVVEVNAKGEVLANGQRLQ
jgi:hypothetical protein